MLHLCRVRLLGGGQSHRPAARPHAHPFRRSVLEDVAVGVAVEGGGEPLGLVGLARPALEGDDVLEKADQMVAAPQRFIAAADGAVLVGPQLTGLALKLVLFADLCESEIRPGCAAGSHSAAGLREEGLEGGGVGEGGRGAARGVGLAPPVFGGVCGPDELGGVVLGVVGDVEDGVGVGEGVAGGLPLTDG